MAERLPEKGRLPDGRFYTIVDGDRFVEPSFLKKPRVSILPPIEKNTPKLPGERRRKPSTEEIMKDFFND